MKRKGVTNEKYIIFNCQLPHGGRYKLVAMSTYSAESASPLAIIFSGLSFVLKNLPTSYNELTGYQFSRQQPDQEAGRTCLHRTSRI